jgi:hypothetical protein
MSLLWRVALAPLSGVVPSVAVVKDASMHPTHSDKDFAPF